MGWFSKSPFESSEDAVKRMVDLVADAAEKAGTPLTSPDREILARPMSSQEPIPEDLRRRVSQLVPEILEDEKLDEGYWDPKNFSHTLQWAGDSHYSNIVAVAEEVISGVERAKPHGWKLAKDRILLIACGFLVVLCMFAIIGGLSFLFGWT
jgi:hypothetical protein